MARSAHRTFCLIYHYIPQHLVFTTEQAIFEGLKAQRDSQGNILIFRPDQNADRLDP
jgi:branched-subunit amino acid aminotransferase/4-amino-4-deoxychorismate lyase